MRLSATVPPVAPKAEDERAFENRIRAYVRREMVRRGLGVTAAADLIGNSQSNLSRILQGERGVSAWVFRRICEVLQIDPVRVFTRDPDDLAPWKGPDFFREGWVPKPGDTPPPRR